MLARLTFAIAKTVEIDIGNAWRTLADRFTLAEIPVGGARASVSAWGKNLLNNKDFEYLFQILPLQIVGTFQTPRTYGLDLKMQF